MKNPIQKLNLPSAKLDIRRSKNKLEIWDIIRKKYIALTAEEWVRQNMMHFLCQIKMFPKSLIQVEKNIQSITEKLRTDILIYNRNGTPLVIVECKSPETRINLKSIYQAGAYQIKLQTPYILITNGLEHFFFKIKDQKAQLFETSPDWNTIKNI